MVGFIKPVVLICMLSSVCFSEPNAPAKYKFSPGKETKVEPNDPRIGGGYFLVFLPQDYNSAKSWPVIFFYNGADCKPSTEFWRQVTDKKGFIIVAMEYSQIQKGKMNEGQYINYITKEIKSLAAAKSLLSKNINIDSKKMFISGISKGGWLASSILETRPRAWAGCVILCAGRTDIVKKPESTYYIEKPIYIGAGETDQNLRSAKLASIYYKSVYAEVEFEEYKGLGHKADPNSPILKKWLISKAAADK